MHPPRRRPGLRRRGRPQHPHRHHPRRGAAAAARHRHALPHARSRSTLPPPTAQALTTSPQPRPAKRRQQRRLLFPLAPSSLSRNSENTLLPNRNAPTRHTPAAARGDPRIRGRMQGGLARPPVSSQGCCYCCCWGVAEWGSVQWRARWEADWSACKPAALLAVAFAVSE